ncbi:HTH domain-containing protein [Halopiger aswanensis]|uniref:Winged helix-turn-helix transcription repressor HrcA DNA-binding domain-containing protein n=1 Tax=Halopiger aswanensis TaxID=148449 RepID=A0A3R7FTL8_9EURY|nr:HTH domain-containing protein [Halopiger aswanensis]RKD89157.1 hypothetical protein ATJ93_3983 [Halopiger aswanensis]
MNQIDLTSRQRRTLTTLINEFQGTDSPITAKQLATELDRDAGTLRNQMQSLTSLGLVEGIPGPKGGYKPTASAYEALDRDQLDDAETVVLARNFDRVDATVDEIEFTNVHHPDSCRARVRFQQSLRELSEGDEIAVGPTPVSSLVLAGVVVAVDDSLNKVIIDVAKLEAPLREDE